MADGQEKRFVCITGDKGGTGKSTFARALLDVYRHRGIPCLAYDSDRRNSQLYRHYKDIASSVTQVDISTRGGADALINDIESTDAQVALLDLPAGAEESFEKFDSEIELITTAANLGYRMTVVSVISRVRASVEALESLINYCDRNVDYVVVKNLFFGEPNKFRRYDESETRRKVQERGGIEINMPDIFDDTFDLIDEHSLTFRDATNNKLLNLAHRMRVSVWLKKLESELNKAEWQLGLTRRHW